jgi:hypothetical protein
MFMGQASEVNDRNGGTEGKPTPPFSPTDSDSSLTFITLTLTLTFTFTHSMLMTIDPRGPRPELK